MFKKHKEHKRRSSNGLFGLVRMCLSLIIFGVLALGVYSAYRQFSGVDPIKMSPKAIIANFTSTDKLIDLAVGILKFDPKNLPNFLTQKKADTAKEEPKNEPKSSGEETQISHPGARSALSFKFALVSDSHNENNYLSKAINQAKGAGAKFIIGLGDYTEVGTLGELGDAKKAFDSGAIRYFVTPGDHDLWDSRDKGHDPKTNFTETFGRTYQAFSYGSTRFIILDNSDNYKGLDQTQLDFYKMELEKARKDSEIDSILVFMHEPLFHPSSDRIMGKVEPKLVDQAKSIIKLSHEASVKGIFFGDIHYYTKYQDPETSLDMVTIGAAASQRNAQLPRFAMVSVFADGSWDVEDVEIR